MSQQQFRIRAPTGTAWLATVTSVIVAGELLYERSKSGTAHLFKVPLSDVELLALSAAFGALGLVALVWLLSLHLKPGGLQIDEERLVRTTRRLWRTVRTDAPLSSWRARIVYFSTKDRNDGLFKKLELASETSREVILPADLGRDGVRLAQTLSRLEPSWPGLEVVVERTP